MIQTIFLSAEETIEQLQQDAYEIHIQHVALINKIKVSGQPATKEQQEALALYEQQLDNISQDIDSLHIHLTL